MLKIRWRQLLYCAELAAATPFILSVGLWAIIGLFLGLCLATVNLFALVSRLPEFSQDTVTLVATFGSLAIASAAGLGALGLLLLLSVQYLSGGAGALFTNRIVLLVGVALSVPAFGFLCVTWWLTAGPGSNMFRDLLLAAIPILVPLGHLALETWMSWQNRVQGS